MCVWLTDSSQTTYSSSHQMLLIQIGVIFENEATSSQWEEYREQK